MCKVYSLKALNMRLCRPAYTLYTLHFTQIYETTCRNYQTLLAPIARG